jgi:hypothetical protein
MPIKYGCRYQNIFPFLPPELPPISPLVERYLGMDHRGLRGLWGLPEALLRLRIAYSGLKVSWQKLLVATSVYVSKVPAY